MNLGSGEIVEAARMIEVEMREDDMAHVARLEAEPFNLTDCRHLFPEFGTDELEEKAAQSALRIGNVAEAEARIDEHETASGFDEQTVARQMPAADDRFGSVVHELAPERTSRDAVQMMNAHRLAGDSFRAAWTILSAFEESRRE